MSYRVVAPLVQLKVRDALGGTLFQHFYAGAIVPDSVDEENLKSQIESGFVEEDGAAHHAMLGTPAGTPLPDQPPNVPVTVSNTTAQPIPPFSEKQVETASKAGRPAQPPRGRQSE
jgi:hypothetical protein